MDYRNSDPDERLSAAEEREQERLDALDLEQQLADESRDNPPLTEAEYTIDATCRGILQSATVLQMQRDSLADTLRDIAMGADMMLQPALGLTGSIEGYIKEVRRVARAGLAAARVK